MPRPRSDLGALIGRCLLLLAPAGCGSVPDVPPGGLVAVPDPATEPGSVVAFARSELDKGDVAAARHALHTLLELHRDDVDVQRLRQDILRDRGRSGLLLYEAQERLRLRPDDPAAHYLMGRLQPRGAPQRQWFEQAIALSPQFFWGWVGLAASLRRDDPLRALAIYRRLRQAAPDLAMNVINLARALLDVGQTDNAEAVYRELRAAGEPPGVGDLGLAQTYLLAADRDQAWAPLLAALLARPWDPGVYSLLEGYVRIGVPDGRLHQVRELLYRSDDTPRAARRAGAGALLAGIHLRLGDPPAARELLGDDDGTPPRSSRARRLWWDALLAQGEVAAFVADLRAWMPRDLIADEGNQLRSRWLALLDGPWAADAEPLAEPGPALGLVDALAAVGMHQRAERVATLALLRHGGPRSSSPATALRQRREQIRRDLAFEAGVRRVLYGGYLAEAEGSLPELFTELRRLSTEVLGEDVVGEPRIYSIPLVGELCDPFGPGLPAWFAARNKHLVLGKRRGLPPEAMLLNRLSLRDVEADPELPTPVRVREVVADERSIEPRTTLVGGDLAGVALVDTYVVEMDAVRDWADGLRRMRRIAAEDDLALAGDPLPEPRHPRQPLDAEWRLALRAPAADADLERAVIDVIRWHERAHVVDTFHFLPPEANLWRVLGLLLRNGLSAQRVEADLEARAELVALARSAHPELVLAHIAAFCQQDLQAFSQHASGFEQLAADLQQRLLDAGAGLDPDDVAVARWHLLDTALVQRVAREMARELW